MISPGKTVVLTFDDAVSNHAAFAAPLLSELGFHATFFICEFPPDFAVNKRQYMTWEQIRSLDAAGFEIANHTMTHAGLDAIAPETCEKEIELLEARFRDVGLPRSRAFGYPGGPAADYAPPLLKKLGFRFARTVEDRAWEPDRDDSYLIPAVAVTVRTTRISGALFPMRNPAASRCWSITAFRTVFTRGSIPRLSCLNRKCVT